MGTLASPNHEWIELYNNSSVEVDLTGWTLKAADGSPSITITSDNNNESKIPAGGYFILRNAEVFSDVATPSFLYSGSFSDGGETLTLRDTRGDIIDTANGNGGVWPAGTLATAANHGTMERLGTVAESDLQWYTSTGGWTKHDIAGNLIHGTPGDANSPLPPSTPTASPTATRLPLRTILISEVAWAGTSSTYSSDEWIELYNPSSFPVDLTGWKLQAADGNPSIALSKTINPGEYFLLENKSDDLVVSNIPADIIYSGSLLNTGERLVLYDPADRLIDSADGTGGWPAGSSSTYGTMERKGIMPDSRDSWMTNTGLKKNGLNRGGGVILGTPKQSNTPPPLPPTATPVPTPIPYKTVVITEVAWAGTAASSSDEWIELFNTTNETIHLDGWELRSLRYNGEDFYINLKIQLKGDIPPRTSTDPGNMSGYFLLETRDDAVENIDADQLYTGSLYNSGEILLLCSPYNLQPGSPAPCNINVKSKLVDYVNGSLTTSGNIKPWPAGSSSTYGSMERKNLISDDVTNYYTHTGLSPHFGVDANGNAIKGTPKHPNWANTVTATPRATYTPTRTPTPRPAAAPILVINEVLARAGTDWNNDGVVDVYDEFIEVINAGTVNLNLSGYKLDDENELGSVPFSLPSQTLKPGEKAVFYGSQTGIRLEDSGDTVRLLKASNNSVVDAVTYTMVKSLDFSVCRYTDGYGSWILGCFPTPGRPNQLTGERFPSTSGGQPIPVCVLPDSVPEEFVLAECEEGGLGIWNPFYWDSSPGEGNEIWQPDERDKWLVIYQ